MIALRSKNAFQAKLEALDDEIAQAKSHLAELEEQYATACLETSEGVTVAPVELRAEVQAARDHIMDLEAAKRALVARRPEIEQAEAENKANRQAAENLLKQHAKASHDVGKALEAFVSARDKLLDVSRELFKNPLLNRYNHEHPASETGVDGVIQVILRDKGVPWVLADRPNPPPQIPFIEQMQRAQSNAQEVINRD